MARDPQAVLQEKQLRLRQIEAHYLRTKEFLKSSEWNVRRDVALLKISKFVMLFRPGMDVLSAGIVFGQIKSALEEIQEVTDVIVEYESIEKELERYYATERTK